MGGGLGRRRRRRTAHREPREAVGRWSRPVSTPPSLLCFTFSPSPTYLPRPLFRTPYRITTPRLELYRGRRRFFVRSHGISPIPSVLAVSARDTRTRGVRAQLLFNKSRSSRFLWRGIQLSRETRSRLARTITIVSLVYAPVDVYIFLYFPTRSSTRARPRAISASRWNRPKRSFARDSSRIFIPYRVPSRMRRCKVDGNWP